jgi:Dyp-type peroxidase family
MLEFDDIQGNVLAGFNTNFQVLAGLAHQEGADWAGVARWLADHAGDITTVKEVREQRGPMKALAEGAGLAWVCLAVSERVMTNTQPDVLFGDDAFRRGMVRRARSVLGDTVPAKEWRIGGTLTPVDVLLIVGSNSRVAAEARAGQLVESAAAVGLAESYRRETAERIEDLEHFGFRDGVSQPRVVGSDDDGDMEPGNFVFGYPRSPGAGPVVVQPDPRGVTRNGSLLVIRRLAQDVERFRSFCAAEAQRLQPRWPGLTPEQLQALIVGRWPQGALVSPAQTADPGPVPNDNDFDFRDDSDGLRCPFGAHIRKVNPRQGPADVVNVPRFLRRGIPFGPRYEVEPGAERGLIFVSFQTSIVETFEFITANWMNSPDRPGRVPGHDLLVGRASPERLLNLNSPAGTIQLSDGGQQWVMPTGGAYLFAPSRSGLSKFAEPARRSLRTTLRRTVMQVTDFLGSD